MQNALTACVSGFMYVLCDRLSRAEPDTEVMQVWLCSPG